MGTLELPNYRIVTLAPDQASALEQACLAHDDRTDQPCRLCGRHCWGVVCRPCKDACTHEYTVNGYLLRVSGTRDAKARCLTCGELWSLRRGAQIANVCVRNNLARQEVPPCARCGATSGTELHHWAPRAIFNDADEWPVAPLCPTCHTTWHNAMRTARGASLPPEQRIGTSPWEKTA